MKGEPGPGLFDDSHASGTADKRQPTGKRKLTEPFGRLDTASVTREAILPLCRLQPGEIWEDPVAGHRVGCLDATSCEDVTRLCTARGMADGRAEVADDGPAAEDRPATDHAFHGDDPHVAAGALPGGSLSAAGRASFATPLPGAAAASPAFTTDPVALVINDPPYNIRLRNRTSDRLGQNDLKWYMDFSRSWISNTLTVMARDSHLYVWLGADIKQGFQPLPDFMLMMREFEDLVPRNLITVRNQRGYGTSRNWMWVRQELLHYVRGRPPFTVTYTDIPKVLKGYYKTVEGRRTENLERSKSDTIRPGNVWIDIQQVFYRLHENVPGAYAQKPLKAIRRIVETSSAAGNVILDLFSHSGTTLIAGEMTERRVFTMDADPVFAELTIRRLEHYRSTGRTGWQCDSPFPEMPDISERSGRT